MNANPQTIPYLEWTQTVDALCRHHLACDWANLCGEVDVLRRSYEMGDTPMQFVQWFAEKYDLFWRDPADQWNPWV